MINNDEQSVSKAFNECGHNLSLIGFNDKAITIYKEICQSFINSSDCEKLNRSSLDELQKWIERSWWQIDTQYVSYLNAANGELFKLASVIVGKIYIYIVDFLRLFDLLYTDIYLNKEFQILKDDSGVFYGVTFSTPSILKLLLEKSGALIENTQIKDCCNKKITKEIMLFLNTVPKLLDHTQTTTIYFKSTPNMYQWYTEMFNGIYGSSRFVVIHTW